VLRQSFLYEFIGLLACLAASRSQNIPLLTEIAPPAIASEASKPPPLPAPFPKLISLHTRLGNPSPGEWLAEHPEPGQTYLQYVRSNPVRPDRKRRVIYVQPLGEFTAAQRKVVSLTAEYMQAYFSLPVRTRDPLPLKLIPASARRKHPTWKVDQILSTYVLEEVLAPRLPADAMAYIAFTPMDLWPGEGWNFVFGQASLSDRVGVWSFNRFGDPDESEAVFKLCLWRTLKLATHETGHMFSMAHCTAFECNMCGSNHLEEADRRPSWLCPQCLAKLCWATNSGPREHFQRLAAFCKASGLAKEQEFYEKSLEAIGGK
jgi:archaemetzincin